MFFRTPLAFAVVAAVSASVMALVGGGILLSAYVGLVHLAVIRSISHLNSLSLVVFVLAVFVLTIPIETVYAKRTLFGKDRPSSMKPVLLLFPVAVAVTVCSRVIEWWGSE